MYGFKMCRSKSISHNLPRPVFLFTLWKYFLLLFISLSAGTPESMQMPSFFPRHWGNQPWHTREALIATCCSPGMVGNLMSIHMPLHTALRKWAKCLSTDSRLIYLSPQSPTQRKVLIPLAYIKVTKNSHRLISNYSQASCTSIGKCTHHVEDIWNSYFMHSWFI